MLIVQMKYEPLAFGRNNTIHFHLLRLIKICSPSLVSTLDTLTFGFACVTMSVQHLRNVSPNVTFLFFEMFDLKSVSTLRQ